MSRTLFWDERAYPEESAALRALSLPDDAVVLGIDLARPAHAAAEMIAARRAGRRIAVFPVLADPQETLFNAVSTAIAEQPREQRIAQTKALIGDRLMVNGVQFSRAAPPPQAHVNAVVLTVHAADLLLVGSEAERLRWQRIASCRIRRVARLTPAADGASTPPASIGASIFAPSTPRAQLRFLERTLRERGIEAEVIAAENHGAAPRGAVVLCPEWWRALRALTLADRGRCVVAPVQGAEAGGGIFTYEPHDPMTLYGALDAARSALAPPRRANARGDSVAIALASSEPACTSGPPVSIVVRTFDRPALLPRAVASIAAQRYENVEIVVVNNGGGDVRALAEAAANGRPLRYLTLPQRSHIGAASNAGVRGATGEYVGYLDDDDILYPDHVSRAMSALRATQADLSFSNCLAEYTAIEDGRPVTLGFQIFLDREYEPLELYVANLAPIHSIVHRRDLFDRFGYFDESLPVTDDWEMWLRASRGGARFVHVDHATCEYSWRYDLAGGNMTLSHQRDFAACYETIVRRYAGDLSDAPSVRALQASSIEMQRSRAETLAAHPERARELLLDGHAAKAVPVAVTLSPAPHSPILVT